MRVVVGFVSQKGGVGKSTLARALAAIAAAVSIRVSIADLDPQQETVARWEERREENEVAPLLKVATFRTVSEALRATGEMDELLIIDAPARASKGTLDIARHADLIVQPSGASVDDLDPAIILFHELVREGVPRERLVMALSRIGNQAEENAARVYVQKAGYAVLPGFIPERAAYRHAHNLGRAVTEVGGRRHEPKTDALMERLLAIITERVKARVQSTKSPSKKGTAA